MNNSSAFATSERKMKFRARAQSDNDLACGARSDWHPHHKCTVALTRSSVVGTFPKFVEREHRLRLTRAIGISPVFCVKQPGRDCGQPTSSHLDLVASKRNCKRGSSANPGSCPMTPVVRRQNVGVKRQLVVNLSALMEKPTGLSVYAERVVPYLEELAPIVLIRESMIDLWAAKHPGLRLESIRDDLSADNGVKGHVRRLAWLETVLAARLRRISDPLLFSPVPEAPLLRDFATVVTVFDFIPRLFYPEMHPLHQYSRRYVPRVLLRAARVMAISEATASDAVRFGGIPRSKIDVTPLACDTTHFRPLGLKRQQYFLYLGRYAPYKNIDSALRGFAKAAIEGFEFWIAGPPDAGFDELMREFRDRQGLAIRFISYAPYADLPRILNEATALVFPSRYEGFGLPILEAMACGTPVITSNVSAMPEVAGDAAILVDPQDVDSLSLALRQVAARDALWARLHDRGLQRASLFSWENVGSQTQDVLGLLCR